jgi:hypothetical protein
MTYKEMELGMIDWLMSPPGYATLGLINLVFGIAAIRNGRWIGWVQILTGLSLGVLAKIVSGQ